jgi:HK97 family phage portal protein
LGLRERLANSFQTKPNPYRPPSFGALSGFDTDLPGDQGGVSFTPNRQTPRYDFMRDTVSDLVIYGNSFWWKAKNAGQRRLIRLPVTLVEPKEGSVLTGPGWYELTTSAGPKRFETGEIVHIRGYNPLDPRIGSPILYSLKGILAEEVSASRHRTGFWRNAARRDGIILRPKESGNWSDDARERFRQDWQNAHSGADNAGKAPILEDGMTWDADSFSPRDSEFIAGRQFGLDTVATALQIPLAMLSRTSTPTFASMKEFRTVLYVDVLGTWSASIESALALQLVPDFNDPDLYVEFNIDEKLQGDFEEQANAARNSVQVPWMSVNEMRAKRGQPPVGDPNDEENPYNSPARPSNYTYAGDPPPQAPGAGLQLAPAASNGHIDDTLARILEDSHD